MKAKIVIWENGNFFPFGLSNSLQHLGEFEFYAIIDTPDKKRIFFQEQKFVKFEKVWYYHDYVDTKNNKIDLSYLKSFEERYGINLYLLALNERLFYHYNEYYSFTNQEILSILESECKLFEKIMQEIKPDFFITLETALHHHHLFYLMCKATNVKILMLYQSKFSQKSLISQEYQKLDEDSNVPVTRCDDRTFSDLQNILKHSGLRSQLIKHKNNFMNSKKEKIKAIFDYLLSSNNSDTKTNYSYYGRHKPKVIFRELYNLLVKKYREFYIDKNLERNIDDTLPFVYFTLHQEPERVLLIGSPFYTNQLETIRNIAKSLPIGYMLYVKEHPTQSIRDWRPVSFYKEVMNVPNVVLLHPSVNNEIIFQKCSLVITVNGTAGLEAAFYQKPSIIFTDLGYASLPSVHKLKSIEELPSAIRLSLQKNVDVAHLNQYVGLIETNSVDFDLINYFSAYHNHFYYGGYLLNVNIPVKKMKIFLDDQKEAFDYMAKEYVKKFKLFKGINTDRKLGN